MGLLLDASCTRCDYEAKGLRLGATHAQIEAHDVQTRELYPTPCCRRVESFLISMGEVPPSPNCPVCQEQVELAGLKRYRISTLKGEVFEGHPCPRCGEPALGFTPRSKFT